VRPALAPGTGIVRKVRGIVLGIQHELPIQFVVREAVSPAAQRGDLGDLVELS
jgi:hypothetical protein